MSWNCSRLQMKSCHSFPIPISNQKLVPNSQHGPEFPAKVVSLHFALTDTEGEAVGQSVDHHTGSLASIIWNWNSLVQSIINLGKHRNYFYFSGLSPLLCSLPLLNFKHSNPREWVQPMCPQTILKGKAARPVCNCPGEAAGNTELRESPCLGGTHCLHPEPFHDRRLPSI